MAEPETAATAERVSAPPFSIADTAVVPPPGMTLPNGLAFSPDDARLMYLLGTPSDPAQKLWALETATGATTLLLSPPPTGGTREEALTLSEVLRRQRQRSRATGVTAFVCADRSERLLVPVRDGLSVLDGPGAAWRRVVAGGDAQMPTLSPDGDRVAFVRDGEVYVASVTAAGAGDTALRQVTSGAREAGKTNGLAEYIAQEELGRREGFWWSPDGQWIAFEEVDERHILPYVIAHQGTEMTGSEAHEEHRYPFAGAENARVRLGVVAADGGDGSGEPAKPVWMDLDFDEAEVYLARVFWWRDGQLGAVIVNRTQRALWLVRYDPATGRRTTVLSEHGDPWINVPARGMIELEQGDIVWASERAGFRHLYVIDRSGAPQRQLTEGKWVVDDLLAVDETGGVVYFTGNRDDPREKQLYAVPLAGGEIRRITQEPGTHEVVIDHGKTRFVDTWSAIDRPPTVTLRALADGAHLQSLPLLADPRVEAFGLGRLPPELVTLRNREGELLYGAVYRPDVSRFGPGPYPTIVAVYGGPHAQEITNSWGRMTANMNLQYLRAMGFLIFGLDNRGSARRGLRFESALARQFGRAEVDDQVDGVRWLVAQGLTDPQRVGITGWSYGGYMALMCLAKASDVFKVAVAGAPVTDYAGYDTAYTERYLETPATNAAGYAQTSVLTHVDEIRGKLLLIHGMLDENVHFRHSARLLTAMIHARKPVDTLFFPDERHMLRFLPNRVYLNERMDAFFLAHL